MTTVNRPTWGPMTADRQGQRTGDIWNLHAYAHPATKYERASWAVYRHTVKIAWGFETSLGKARRAAERVLASCSAGPSLSPR